MWSFCFIVQSLRYDFLWFYLSLLEVGWWVDYLFLLCRRLNELIFRCPVEKIFVLFEHLTFFIYLSLSEVGWRLSQGISSLCCQRFRRETMNNSFSRRSVALSPCGFIVQTFRFSMNLFFLFSIRMCFDKRSGV